MKKIKLTKNRYALVDAEDFDYLSQWKWQYGLVGYAYRSLDKKTKVYMHRCINKTPKGKFTDHINRDKLDNRKTNLRTVTGMENGRNRGKNKNNTSGYKGVSWDKSKKSWLAHIKVNYKLLFLGRFKDIKDAIKARKNGEEGHWT